MHVTNSSSYQAVSGIEQQFSDFFTWTQLSNHIDKVVVNIEIKFSN
jgi:hypothetical protein